ncbi:hypothetical protein [Phytopseudomonas argentinensis]|uniref:hypothetical protein n=1 Tax=Phytopseudomonas argentinensis TaxID=289370 RepID=UPI001FCA1A03|nr:hypothetical protein [Pseudomonas argentinensis]
MREEAPVPLGLSLRADTTSSSACSSGQFCWVNVTFPAALMHLFTVAADGSVTHKAVKASRKILFMILSKAKAQQTWMRAPELSASPSNPCEAYVCPEHLAGHAQRLALT